MTRRESIVLAARLARRGYVASARAVIARTAPGPLVIEVRRPPRQPDPARAVTTPLPHFDANEAAAAWIAEMRAGQAVRS